MLASKSGHEDLPRIYTFDGFHHSVTLFLHRRDVAPQLAELFSSFLSSEAARDLLLDFQHPQITLRLIVVERHSEVRHEQQNFISLDE